MPDSVRPHRWQPTRLPRPWDFPGKNTGVGCHVLLQCMKVKSESEVAQSCPTLRDPTDCSLLGSSVHGISQARVLEWVAIYYSATKREWNKVICSNMDGPRDCHTEWSKSEKDKYHMISLTCGIKKRGANELIYKTEVENKLMITRGKAGRDKFGDWDWHIYITIYKIRGFSNESTLCTPTDCSLPGSSIHRVLQVRILE